MINTNFTDKNGKNYLKLKILIIKANFVLMDSLQQLSDQQNNSNRYSFNLAYTEPVGKKGKLQFNYNPSFQKSHADQETFKYDYGMKIFIV